MAAFESAMAKLGRWSVEQRVIWRWFPFFETRRRASSKRYRNSAERWAVISDFDGNLKFKVDRSTFMGSCIYWHGSYSRRDLKTLGDLLKPDMVFCDIGANQGEFTVYVAGKVPQGKVLSFEPVPDLYKQMTESVELNGFKHVLPFNCALSDEPGTLKMYSADVITKDSVNEGLASLYPSETRTDVIAEAKVEVFDDLFAKQALSRLDGMKIDVEGAELHVLKGARETISKYKPFIMMEFNPEHLQEAGCNPDDVLALLEELGYSISKIVEVSQFEPVSRAKPPEACNVLCRPAK